MGREHFIISTCNLERDTLLLDISIHAAYLITLIMIVLVCISLVQYFAYLNTSFKTDSLKLTLDMMLFIVAVLVRPHVK